MADYEYNHNDAGLVKSAYLSLLQDEDRAFKVGVASFFVALYLLPKHFKFRSRNAFFTSFFFGGLGYNSYLHQAKNHYFRVS